mgnify:FL=1
MPYIPPELVAEARQVDLLTYLKNYEPYELVEVCRNTYTTKSHDSLKISNGLWYWFTKGVGGKSAIDYLIKVRNYTFINAVQTVLGNIKIQAPIQYKQQEKDKEKHLKIPIKAINNDRAINYLLSRGIDKDIINYCIENKLLYQEEKTNNVVFIGYNNDNIPSYAFCRATNQERFMREATGSNKRYSFKIKADKESNIVHLFESSIDLLSYATLLHLENKNWRAENLLSLGGIYSSKYDVEKTKIPVSLTEFLERNPNVNEIHLHLDRDLAGRNASSFFQQVLSEKYKIFDDTIPFGKDVNEYLCLKTGIKKFEKERTR